MKSKIFASIALAAACAANAVTVSSVTARQRWPWSAMMDIDFTLEDTSAPTANYLVQVTATYAQGTESVTARTFANEPVFTNGTHRLVWNLGRDLPNVKATDFTVTVTATPYAESTGSYLVFDLSGGSTAKHYPHWYSSTPPEVQPNTAQACKTTEMWFRRVPAGTITQGNGETGTKNSLPAHSVTISGDYYVAIFETTQQQWHQIFGEWKGSWSNEQWRAARPVEYIDTTNGKNNNGAIRGNWTGFNVQSSIVDCAWNSMVGFLRSKTGFKGIDLPTEAQWEHACRAGTTGERYSDKPVAELARCGATDSEFSLAPYENGSTNGTAVVGSYEPNPWGLYDMYGNVLEICLDRWEEIPSDMTPYSGTDPVGSVTAANENYRVCKGGYYSASSSSSVFTSYYRRSFDYFSSWLGFRLVINLGPYGTREQ